MDETRRLAETVRNACIEAAIQAYEDAGFRGLCGEGRWEYAIGAVKTLDLASVIERARTRSD